MHPLYTPLGIGKRPLLLVPRVDIGQSSHVARTLDIVLPTQRIDTRAGLAEISGDHSQIGQRQHIVSTGRVLGHAH